MRSAKLLVHLCSVAFLWTALSVPGFASDPAARYLRASVIIDHTVVNSSGQELGEIEDLVIRQNGKVKKVVLSIGGFLDIGDRLVGVRFRSLKFESDQTIVYDATLKEMMDYPKFDFRERGIYRGYYYRPYLFDRAYGPYGGDYAPPAIPYEDRYGPRPHYGRMDVPGYYRYPYGYPPDRYPHDVRHRRPYRPWDWAFFPDRMISSVLLGQNVINQKGQELGEIDDLIISAQGKVVDLIISAGGVLGIGDKLVSLRYKPIGFTAYGIIYDISRSELQDKPPYRYSQE